MGILDPETQGLLQAAFTGLAASGPSRMPVGLGQVLGGAGSAGLAGYDQAAKLQSALVLQDIQTKVQQAHLQQMMQDLAIQKQFFGESGGGGFGDMMNDPVKLRAFGLATKRPEFLTHAERLEKQTAEDLQLASYKARAQTIQPDPQELAQSADLGTPAVQPTTVQSGGIFAPLMFSPVQGIASQARAYQAALNAQPSARGMSPTHWTDLMKELSTAERTALNRQETLALREELPGIIAGLRNPQFLQASQGIFQVGAGGGLTTQLDPETGQRLTPSAAARIDLSRAAQLQRQFNAASKPSIDALGSISAYRAARATGDTAQAALMAAEALRRSARQGNQRFKGELGTLLGSGYGGGSLLERAETFLSQEGFLTGNPSDRVLKKMDGLADAMELSNLEQIARWHKHYAGQATAQGLPIKNVVGAPMVEGRYIIFPDGKMGRATTPEEALAKAQEWVDNN